MGTSAKAASGIILSLFLASCASFKSGDVYVSRANILRMEKDVSKKPFRKIKFEWKVVPYSYLRSRIHSKDEDLGPVPAPKKETEFFKEQIGEIFSEAGLFSPEKGEGELVVKMLSMGNWTYRDIFGNFLVETPWIMIFPASLRVRYVLTAEFSDANGEHKTTNTAEIKTVFHPLMIPLYPLSRPAGKQRSVIRMMLWKAATDIYMEKAAGSEIKMCNSISLLRENLSLFSGSLDGLPVLSDFKTAVRRRIKDIRTYLFSAERACPYEENIKEFYSRVEKKTLSALGSIGETMSNLPKYGYPPDSCWEKVYGKKPENMETYNEFLEKYLCCAKYGTGADCSE